VRPCTQALTMWAQNLLDEHAVPVQFVETMDERDEAVAFRKRAKLFIERFVLLRCRVRLRDDCARVQTTVFR
jgi:hypothetical protein